MLVRAVEVHCTHDDMEDQRHRATPVRLKPNLINHNSLFTGSVFKWKQPLAYCYLQLHSNKENETLP